MNFKYLKYCFKADFIIRFYLFIITHKRKANDVISFYFSHYIICLLAACVHDQISFFSQSNFVTEKLHTMKYLKRMAIILLFIFIYFYDR